MSFALTTAQIRNQTKTVTRRLGWAWLKPGTLLQPVVKAQGLKRGEHVEAINGPIRVISVVRERLDDVSHPRRRDAEGEVAREGFPGLAPTAFVEMFASTHGCAINAFVTRIEFSYVSAEPTLDRKDVR